MRPAEGAGSDELGRMAEEKEQVGRAFGLESRMAVRRDDRAEKYILIGVGHGERWRFSIGVADTRHASDDSMRNESCILMIMIGY